MKTPATHTAQVHAWLGEYHSINGLFDSKPEQIATALAYSQSGPGTKCYYEKEGHTYIGTATITLTVAPPKEILQSKVKGLQAKKREILATAQKQATELESQIQKLLAISFDGAEA